MCQATARNRARKTAFSGCNLNRMVSQALRGLFAGQHARQVAHILPANVRGGSVVVGAISLSVAPTTRT